MFVCDEKCVHLCGSDNVSMSMCNCECVSICEFACERLCE